jgi:acetoacetyl-CoA synthetase
MLSLRDAGQARQRFGENVKHPLKLGRTLRAIPAGSERKRTAEIIAVADIPRTKSGQIAELAVRDTVHGRSVENKDALANPEPSTS